MFGSADNSKLEVQDNVVAGYFNADMDVDPGMGFNLAPTFAPPAHMYVAKDLISYANNSLHFDIIIL